MMQDYFEFFGIDRNFSIDTSALRKKYILNNKKHHPDFHTLGSQKNQDEVLRLSTLNNEAYKVLSDDRMRTLHLLRLENAMPEEGKAQVPQDFLIEMMDVNEALMDAKMSEDKIAIQQLDNQLTQLEDKLSDEAESDMKIWDTSGGSSNLKSIRDIYLKQQYIRRLRDQLQDKDPEH